MATIEEKFQLVLLMNGFGHIAASLLYAPLANRFGRRDERNERGKKDRKQGT